MASDSDLVLDNDKAQQEALVHEVDESEYKVPNFSLIWRPATFILIPLALAFITIYLGLSWTEYFADHLGTVKWLYPNHHLPEESVYWTCLPNGTATPQTMFSVWDTSQFLDITLGFGSFQFGLAKGIDVVWDMVIGRGGQIVLALLSCRVLSAALLHSMETRAASFKSYVAIGLDRGPVFTIWASVRDLWTRRSQEPLVLVTVMFASIYLLAFQTFVSTMTGYKPISTPWVHLDTDALYPAQDILRMGLILKDGSRIGLKDDFPVAYLEDLSGTDNDHGCPKCSAFETNLAKATWNYCLDSPVDDNAPSYFMLNGVNISLPAPRLTLEGAAGLWMHDNKSYTENDLRPICQPGNKYQWGFSFYVLLTFCIITIASTELDRNLDSFEQQWTLQMP
ncbi:hypothetical protein KCU73_g7158, partial [Aureobasidium melanogenum]